jgi:UDP-3-O-[3-hydroxymyristoyl] glucosamine N-acyltransferase
MADSRFFNKSSSFTLREIAEATGSVISGGNINPDMVIEDVAPLDSAESNNLSFFENVKYKDNFLNSKAGACFVSAKAAAFAPDHMALLVSPYPYKSYAIAAGHFYPDKKPDTGISQSSFIEKTSEIGDNTTIETGAIIKAKAVIGKACWIESGAVIGENVILGDGVRIGSNAVISHSIIGNNVRVYPGACVGQDGFGFAIDPKGHVKVPQLGRVVIKDYVQIGSNTTIDRGAGPDTIIGQGTWIDNLVQIGHNVQIGAGCIIVSQVGISGSTELGDFVAMGGQSGVAGHLKIASGARIAAQSGIMRDVPPGEEQMGSPAVPIKQFMRQVATLARLSKKK